MFRVSMIVVFVLFGVAYIEGKLSQSQEKALKQALGGFGTPLKLKLIKHKWNAYVRHGPVKLVLSEEKTFLLPSKDFWISSNVPREVEWECNDLKDNAKSGIYRIIHHANLHKRVEVFCDMKTDHGGWTVIQRRVDGSEDFQRGWKDYKYGFGNVSSEFWLGNEIIHAITMRGKHQLRIDMETFSGKNLYAKYTTFSVGDEKSGYKLTVGGFSGNAGDSMTYSNGAKFTTKDKDLDVSGSNCAQLYSPFWHRACMQTTPNGHYIQTGSYKAKTFKFGITWLRYQNTWNISMKKFSMMIKRI